MYLERKEIGMKKIACVLVMACVITAGAFAQQKPGASAPAASGGGGGGSSAKVFKNSIGLDVVPFFAGLYTWEDESAYSYIKICLSFSYERLIVSHFSIGGNLDTWFGNYNPDRGDDISDIYFAMAGEARYYPLANFDKLFFGADLGFNVYSVDGKTKEDRGGFVGLLFAVKTGYKVQTSKGFFMEPSLSYVFSESSIYPVSLTPGGWDVGLRLGFSF